MSGVRPATVDDARAIAEIHVGAWQAAYRGIFPADFLASLSVEKRVKAWEGMLAGPRPGEHTWVAERDGAVVGWIQVVDGPGESFELQALYVAPDRWRGGVGRALWHTAIASVQRNGARTAWLWVLAGNTPAIAFYEQAGFVAVPGANEPMERGGALAWKVRYVHPGPLLAG
ncbi:MAG: GNAT family N-acetyltransferase [Luteimonas sp.]